MTRRNTELDQLRAGRSELENHYMDELVAGRLDRRTFIRRGSAIGLSATFLGTVLAACGSGGTSSSSSGTGTGGGTAVKGGTLRIAASTPATAINPLLVDDAGGLLMLNQTGEFLIFDSNLKLALQPASSSPTADLEHVRRGLFASYLRREPVFQGGFSRAAKQHTRRNDTAEVVAATSSSLL
jgi:hypothetical protein